MFELGGRQFNSRFLLGTAQYPSLSILKEALVRSKTEIVTVSVRREEPGGCAGEFWDTIRSLRLQLLPNTAGATSARSAVVMAAMCRELFDTNWIKLEIISDEVTLQPDLFETVEAARELVRQGFEVFPYITPDSSIGSRLLEIGCRALMPVAAPVGTGMGLADPLAMRILRERFPNVPLIIDAGIGRPSHAVQAMEMGYDAILLNTAVAKSGNPVRMAEAFAEAVVAGRLAYQAGYIPTRERPARSSPIEGVPFEEARVGSGP